MTKLISNRKEKTAAEKLNLDKMNKTLARTYNNRVRVELNEDNRSIVLTGELDDWKDIVSACSSCVYNRDGWHVVNHIRLNGYDNDEIAGMHKPVLNDNALEGARPDVLVIGGGVVGSAITRELTKWQLDILMVDKEADVAVQASSRNDGQIHCGVDQKKPTLKLKYELLGNSMYSDICHDLGVPLHYKGQYVAFKDKKTKYVLEAVAAQRRKLGITDTRVIGKEELYAAQPNLNEGYDVGLFNSRSGTVCPYGLTIAYAENAIQNGARISLNTAVTSMEVGTADGSVKSFDIDEGYDFDRTNRIAAVHTNRGTIYPRLVINAAGIFSDKIAAMAGDEFFSLHPRRGTEAILDNKKGELTDSIVSYRDLIVKGEKNTKGGGILHTVDGNLLVGPDAVETVEREDYSTHPESIEWLFNKQKKTIALLNERDIITYFTGVRAANFEEDFVVEPGRSTENILHCACIQSPGLTAAPALGVDVARMAAKMLSADGDIEKNADYNPVRRPIPRLREMPEDERAELIRENPDYGVIVCRCEEISRGEILDALRSPLCVPTVDGVKRRVRPGMGRCQGGFCGPVVSEIIAEFLGTEIKNVTKCGNASVISYGDTKAGAGTADSSEIAGVAGNADSPDTADSSASAVVTENGRNGGAE